MLPGSDGIELMRNILKIAPVPVSAYVPVLTFDVLLERVWSPDHSDGRRSLRTYIKRLRRKLREDARSPRYIFAENRVGYRMGKPETPEREES